MASCRIFVTLVALWVTCDGLAVCTNEHDDCLVSNVLVQDLHCFENWKWQLFANTVNMLCFIGQLLCTFESFSLAGSSSYYELAAEVKAL